MTFSEDELRAYLAGAAEPDLAARIEAALETDDDLARKLMALDQMAPKVRDAMADLPGDARAEAALTFAPTASRPAPARRRFSLAAAASLLGVAIGWGGGLLWPAGAPADWRMEVANYQALYTEATIAPITPDAARIDADLARISTLVDADLPGPDLRALDGMRLIRAQVLGFEGAPLAQIVYRNAGGAPIALCVIRTGAGGEQALSTDRLRGLASASWSSGGVEYLMIGGDDAGWLRERAEDAKAVLARAAKS